jgi:hypothetical protein
VKELPKKALVEIEMIAAKWKLSFWSR